MRWCLVIAGLMTGLTAHAGDWPQWLGPNRDGTSAEVVKPWKGDLKVLWRVPVGEGHSSPVVAEGMVYLFDKIPGKDEERLTGWTVDGKQVGTVTHGRGPFSSQFGVGPRATPTVAGGQVYTLGVTGVLARQQLRVNGTGGADVQTGFNTDTLKEFKAKNLLFGVSASPLLEGDLIVVQVGAKDGGVVAYDRKTGRPTWHVLDDPASYAAPVAFGSGASRQIVVLTGLRVVGLSPASGTLLWEFPFRDTLAESSTTPVKIGDLVIVSSVTLGSAAVRLTAKDGKPAAEQVWRKPELTCYFSTPVPVGKDHIYMATGSLLSPSITLRCVETATGKTVWSKPKMGKYHAALLRTGDDKLLMLDDSGHLTLIQPDPAGYKELARSKVCGETWAHPALANGRLYIRDTKELICLQLGE